jgi:RNA polymerase sigma-70 factor (ECF subfamily)
MGTSLISDAGSSDELLRRARVGDYHALAELFARYRGRLRRMVRLRLDHRLQGRVDPSDVLQEAQRAEVRLLLQEALNGMDPLDREVLTLRHFEELSNAEVAQVLGLTKTAASNRHIRALERLREIHAGIPGLLAP